MATIYSNAVPSDGSRVNVGEGGGDLRSYIGLATVAADQASGDIIRYVRVPTNAVVRSVLLTTGDATTAGNIDIGVYYPEANGGAVIDADFFSSAFALTGGPFARSEQAFESGEYAVAERIQPLWEALGLTEDPGGYFDIAATITTTFNGADTSQLVEVQAVSS